MSTKNQAAAAGGSITMSQIKQTLAAAKENLGTKNGKIFIFAVQFLLSLVTLFYFRGVVKMSYYSLFYRLDIPEEHRGRYCFLVSMVCIFYGILMIFTRRQIVTRWVIMCSMPFYLPIFLFNYKHLVLIIPLALMILITYLASGTKEGPKTILGAVFLMLYVIGAFVFLTMRGILQPNVTDCVIQRDISPLGNYRWSVVQELDQANGNIYVALEPNTADIDYGHSKWIAKGFQKDVYRERPITEFEVEWSTKSRAEITRELIANNPNTAFDLNATQMKLLGLDKGYEKTYTISQLSRGQRHKLGYASEDDSIDRRLAKFLRKKLIGGDYEVTLNFEQMTELGLSPTYNIRLSKMTDEDLAILGVPEENEVLQVNGKTVFRQYVAELERIFWSGSRSLTAFLEPNEVPDVHPEGLDIPEPETTAETTTTTELTQSTETTETTADTTAAN